jgi:hypothetical protein
MGLGIFDLDVMNISLLSKWFWKLFNETSLWQHILTTQIPTSTIMAMLQNENWKTAKNQFLGGRLAC